MGCEVILKLQKAAKRLAPVLCSWNKTIDSHEFELVVRLWIYCPVILNKR